MLVLLLLFFRKVLPPACHLERSPPEIPPSLCSVLLRSSTSPTALRFCFAQNDTGGRSRNPKGERQRRSDLAGRLKPALWKVPFSVCFLFFQATVAVGDRRACAFCGCGYFAAGYSFPNRYRGFSSSSMTGNLPVGS